MGKGTFRTSTLTLGILLLSGIPVIGQDNSSATINHATAFAVSAPLRELAKLPGPAQYGYRQANPVGHTPIPKMSSGTSHDPVEQNHPGSPTINSVTLGVSFFGVGTGFPNYIVTVAPPDTNMAVGDTQIVQWVNVSYAVFDRSGDPLSPAFDGNLIWASTIPGSLCAKNNSGEPIVQWDRAAHRWLLAQNVLVAPYAVCVAVSTSSDALGNYYVYQFNVPGGGLPDYPKWGVWSSGGASDGYFQTQNNLGANGNSFQGAQVCAYDRLKMLAGDATAEQLCQQLTLTDSSLLPADVDSPNSPPTNQDEFLVGSLGNPDTSNLSLYAARVVSWTAPLVVTGPVSVPVPTYTGACNGIFRGNCVPQKDAPDLLESLGDRVMYRFAYWAEPIPGTALPIPLQHWLVNYDVWDSTNNANAVRWYDFTTSAALQSSPAALSLTPDGQVGTYSPDANWRWMGSIARDKVGDILVGYSESGTSIDPSIYIAGRTPTSSCGNNCLDPEVAVVQATHAQPGTNGLWGSYSAMRIDPVDNCTFWYTTEYYTMTLSLDWSTRIASAKFPNCN